MDDNSKLLANQYNVIGKTLGAARLLCLVPVLGSKSIIIGNKYVINRIHTHTDTLVLSKVSIGII